MQVILIYACLLAAVRVPILKRTPNRLVRATAFLHGDYMPDYFHWEVIELVRRTVLTGWCAAPSLTIKQTKRGSRAQQVRVGAEWNAVWTSCDIQPILCDNFARQLPSTASPQSKVLSRRGTGWRSSPKLRVTPDW